MSFVVPHEKPPVSSSSFCINLAAGCAFLASIYLNLHILGQTDSFMLALTGLGAAIAILVAGEIAFLKVHRRPRVSWDGAGRPDAARVAAKLVGYYGWLLLLAAFYALVPEYGREFYMPFKMLALTLLIPALVGGWLYISATDGRMSDPFDGLWHFGQFLRRRPADRKAVIAYLKSLLLRAYFIPVMFVYIVIHVTLMKEGVDAFIAQEMGQMGQIGAAGLIRILLMVYFFFMTLDVLFAVSGYLLAFRAIDADVRSTEPTLFGWVVCILCYYPFWELLVIPYVLYDLYHNQQWHVRLADYPLLAMGWGALAVMAMCLESLTTLTFGARFSNLTWRGLISTGPFRFTKHPQYLAKLLNRFLVYMPFIGISGFAGAGTTMGMFGLLCLVYYFRARTEENHLSRYAEYVAYAEWIDRRGIFRFMNRLFPFCGYHADRAVAGRLFGPLRRKHPGNIPVS